MLYNEARQYITDGDVISVLDSSSIYGKLIKLFTGKYTHTGMAVWLDSGLWMVELNGGRNHAIPLSQLVGREFDVHYPPEDCDVKLLRFLALTSLREVVHYGFVSIAPIGIIEYFNLDVLLKWNNIAVCSSYIGKILRSAGWKVDSIVMSPTRMASKLKLKLEVRCA